MFSFLYRIEGFIAIKSFSCTQWTFVTFVCINADFHPESILDFRVLSIDGIMLPFKKKTQLQFFTFKISCAFPMTVVLGKIAAVDPTFHQCIDA